MIIDSHHHLWRLGQNGHQWPTPDLSAIYRDYDGADQAHVFSQHGIEAGILVQSQPSDADTDWLCGLADRLPYVAGVVAWADLATPDAAQRIATLAKRPKVKGLRPMLQGLPDDAWILRPEVQPALAAMVDHGLSFDALVFTRHLPAIETLARRYPGLAIVIDHAAKPPIAAADPARTTAWHEAISRTAQAANILCKLSGLFTEMAPGQDRRDALPYLAHILAEFGPQRLMWGSDWPVVDLEGGYGGWLGWTQQRLQAKNRGMRDAILFETARAFYRL